MRRFIVCTSPCEINRKVQCQDFDREARYTCFELTGKFCASISSEDVMSFNMLIIELYIKNKSIAQSPFVIFY